MVGSSIIRWAEWRAFESQHSILEGISRHGADIHFHGISGLRWHQLEHVLFGLMHSLPCPNIIVIHCGGNDLCRISCLNLRNIIVNTFSRLADFYPGCILVWSQILPRFIWRGARNHQAVELSRARLNSFVASHLVRNFGGYIWYPEIHLASPVLYWDPVYDGVHLSDIGNDIFLNNLQAGLEQLLMGEDFVFPNFYETEWD